MSAPFSATGYHYRDQIGLGNSSDITADRFLKYHVSLNAKRLLNNTGCNCEVMARTRAQGQAGAGEAAEPVTKNRAEKDNQKAPKRSRSNTDTQGSTKAKAAKTEETQPKSESNHGSTDTGTTKTRHAKVDQLISKYATQLPLQHLLKDPSSATPETILAHLLNAMLSSARISHAIAAKTVDCVLEARYHDIATLKQSSWEERTEVLTEGGYTRYREKTATALGELAALIQDKYGKLRHAWHQGLGSLTDDQQMETSTIS